MKSAMLSLATLSILLSVLLAPTALAESESPSEMANRIVRTQPWLSASSGAGGQRPYDPGKRAEEVRDSGGSEARAGEARNHERYLAATTIVAETVGDRYAGGALDSEDGVFHTYVVNPTEEERDYAAAALKSRPELFGDAASRLRIHSVSHSFTDLQAAKELVDEQLTVDRFERVVVVLSVRTNEVKVIVSDENTFTAEERSRWPSSVVQEVDSDLSVRQSGTCSSRTNCLNDKFTRGGIESSGCTMGYSAESSWGSEYTVTAGHCLPTNYSEAQYHNGSRYGWFLTGGNAWYSGSPVDAGRVEITDWTAGDGWIYHTDSTQKLRVAGLYGYSYCSANCNGFTVYKAGITRGLNSGTIYDSLATVGGHSKSLRYYNDSCGGDSGGPVYVKSGSAAVGVAIHTHRSGTPTYTLNGQTCAPNGGGSHLDYALDELSLTLKTY